MSSEFLVQVRLGRAAGKDGVEALGKLPHLQACGFESSRASVEALQAVSAIRGLTSVEVCLFLAEYFLFRWSVEYYEAKIFQASTIALSSMYRSLAMITTTVSLLLLSTICKP